MLRPTSEQSEVGIVVVFEPNCVLEPGVTCELGGEVTLYFVKALRATIISGYSWLYCIIVTYEPQVITADERMSFTGTEYVAGFDKVTLRVSNVQYVHSSEAGKASSPPVAL